MLNNGSLTQDELPYVPKIIASNYLVIKNYLTAIGSGKTADQVLEDYANSQPNKSEKTKIINQLLSIGDIDFIFLLLGLRKSHHDLSIYPNTVVMLSPCDDRDSPSRNYRNTAYSILYLSDNSETISLPIQRNCSRGTLTTNEAIIIDDHHLVESNCFDYNYDLPVFRLLTNEQKIRVNDIVKDHPYCDIRITRVYSLKGLIKDNKLKPHFLVGANLWVHSENAEGWIRQANKIASTRPSSNKTIHLIANNNELPSVFYYSAKKIVELKAVSDQRLKSGIHIAETDANGNETTEFIPLDKLSEHGYYTTRLEANPEYLKTKVIEEAALATKEVKQTELGLQNDIVRQKAEFEKLRIQREQQLLKKEEERKERDAEEKAAALKMKIEEEVRQAREKANATIEELKAKTKLAEEEARVKLRRDEMEMEERRRQYEERREADMRKAEAEREKDRRGFISDTIKLVGVIVSTIAAVTTAAFGLFKLFQREAKA